MSCGGRVSRRAEKCRNCGKDAPGGDWLSQGTGFCAHCAQARVAFAERSQAGRRWLTDWMFKLDTHRRVVLPLRTGRYG